MTLESRNSSTIKERCQQLMACRTDEDFAALEAIIKANDLNEAKDNYQSVARHVVCACDDSIGFAAEAWRNSMMYRLHASAKPGLSPRKVRRRQKKYGIK